MLSRCSEITPAQGALTTKREIGGKLDSRPLHCQGRRLGESRGDIDFRQHTESLCRCFRMDCWRVKKGDAMVSLPLMISASESESINYIVNRTSPLTATIPIPTPIPTPKSRDPHRFLHTNGVERLTYGTWSAFRWREDRAYAAFSSNPSTSRKSRLNSCLGNAPVIICGFPSIGMKSRLGMLVIPNMPASSCSASVLTL